MSVRNLATDPHQAIKAKVESLHADVSVELTPREAQESSGHLAQILPAATKVFITYLPSSDLERTVAATRAITRAGLQPVPHIAARSIPSLDALDAMIGQLTESGASQVLVIGGSLSTPVGALQDSVQVLHSGVLERHGIGHVFVAGHPEGNQEIGAKRLRRAISQKNDYADSTDATVQLVTQFGFDAAPIVAWEQELRAAGNTLPIRVGLPGLASPVSLAKFGVACGVGASLKVLRKQSGGLLRLATKRTYHPDSTILGLASAGIDSPNSLITDIHYFPFGTLRTTAPWALSLRHGQFDVSGGHLRVGA